MTEEQIDEVAAGQLETILDAERRRVTIMFADLRGFTSKSDREPRPENVLKILNNFCRAVFDTIVKYGGLICEIRGDALLIIFGARGKTPDRCLKAAACAISMPRAMSEANRRNREDGLPADLEMGIGINDAEVVLGSIGTRERSGYGIVGNGVNITARIESLSAGGEILISESVYKRIRNLSHHFL